MSECRQKHNSLSQRSEKMHILLVRFRIQKHHSQASRKSEQWIVRVDRDIDIFDFDAIRDILADDPRLKNSHLPGDFQIENVFPLQEEHYCGFIQRQEEQGSYSNKGGLSCGL